MQKGIIHRDIKPTNVMVTQRDGMPLAKVIDFGIAKATNQRLTEKTLFTRYAQIIGTPAYMSPEQAEFGELDIDTRTDIYSLGILLYELLTGQTPFSEEQLRQAGYLEMQRVIREEEPTKPSTRLSTLGDTLTEIAQQRSVTPDTLRRLIRGDLDWIAMKSLDKDRTRRYDTASALALDIQRHLGHEPILARAPKTAYLLQKYLQRHRSQTIAVASVAFVVVAMLAVLKIWFENRALHAEVEASKDHTRLSRAREYFATGDFTSALKTAESIQTSEYVGSETQTLRASVYLHRAQYYESEGDKDNVIADMERYVDILDPLPATIKDNHQSKDMLVGLWRGTAESLGATVNSPSYDYDPHISADGLELYFTSTRPGGYGSYDIWVTTRETAKNPWGKPINLGPTVNSSDLDGGASTSDNGLELYFISTRPGGSGGLDVWVTKRISISEPWGEPVNLGSTVNSSFDDGGGNSLKRWSVSNNELQSPGGLGGNGPLDINPPYRLRFLGYPSKSWF